MKQTQKNKKALERWLRVRVKAFNTRYFSIDGEIIDGIKDIGYTDGIQIRGASRIAQVLRLELTRESMESEEYKNMGYAIFYFDGVKFYSVTSGEEEI